MTHEELLAEIDFLPLHGLSAWMQPALRAVVKLHQQIDDNSCYHCATWYPCSTIQAIEKELL